MADYFTQFSCLLDVGTADNARRALTLYEEQSEDEANEEPWSGGFDLVVNEDNNPAELWIYADVHGDPEYVIQFVKRCAQEFRLTGRWGFQYAQNCSKMRTDAFGGGGHALDLATGETLGFLSTDEWLADLRKGGGDASDH